MNPVDHLLYRFPPTRHTRHNPLPFRRLTFQLLPRPSHARATWIQSGDLAEMSEGLFKGIYVLSRLFHTCPSSRDSPTLIHIFSLSKYPQTTLHYYTAPHSFIHFPLSYHHHHHHLTSTATMRTVLRLLSIIPLISAVSLLVQSNSTRLKFHSTYIPF